VGERAADLPVDADGIDRARHNGNLTNTRELAAMLPPESGFAGLEATSDTDVLTELIAGGAGADGGVEEASARILPLVRGAYSLVYMDENTLYAARDPQGFRPLVIGRLSGGWVAASETAALDIVGASFVREVEPGELISLDERGVRSRRFAAAAPKVCLFEYVYLARPDTTIGGRGCTRPGSRSGGAWRPSTRRRRTWSFRCPSPGPPRRSATPRPAESLRPGPR